MIHKNYTDGTTRIYASEFAGIADLLKQSFTPGLMGASGLLNISTAGTTIAAVDFVPGDLAFSGGALATSLLTASLDFATAGPSGAALPAGTYKVYLRVDDSLAPTGNKRYSLALAVTNETNSYDVDDDAHADAYYTGAVDEQVYLVVRSGIVWSGAAFTDDGDDERAERWGLIDLAEMASGERNEILINGRNVRIEAGLTALSVALAGLSVFAVDFAAGGYSTVLDYHDIDVREGVKIDFSEGGVEITTSGGDLLFDLGESSRLTLGNASMLTLDNGSAAWLSSDALLYVLGSIVIESEASFEADTPLRLFSTPTGTPEKDGLYRAGVLRASALITLSGTTPTIRDSFNVAGVTRLEVGKFRVQFSRAFTDAYYSPSPTAEGENYHATTGLRAANYVDVWVRETDGTHSAADESFSLLVFGGEQA